MLMRVFCGLLVHGNIERMAKIQLYILKLLISQGRNRRLPARNRASNPRAFIGKDASGNLPLGSWEWFVDPYSERLDI